MNPSRRRLRTMNRDDHLIQDEVQVVQVIEAREVVSANAMGELEDSEEVVLLARGVAKQDRDRDSPDPCRLRLRRNHCPGHRRTYSVQRSSRTSRRRSARLEWWKRGGEAEPVMERK